MEDRNISIVAPDRTVVIDGQGFQCEDFPVTPEGLHAIHWRPKLKAPFGHYEWVGKPDNEKTFSNFGRLSGYVDAWVKAKSAQAKQLADIEAKVKAQQREAQALMETQKVAMEAQKARMERMRPYYEALAALGASDHEVLKAAEAGTQTDPALVAKRAALRSTARAEKQKLRDEGILE